MELRATGLDGDRHALCRVERLGLESASDRIGDDVGDELRVIGDVVTTVPASRRALTPNEQRFLPVAMRDRATHMTS